MLRSLFIFTLFLFSFGKDCFARSFTDLQLNNDDGRIVGGVDTTIEEHPYQVSLILQQEPMCGGSLIKLNVVLTAAHCVIGWEPYPQYFSVRAGSTYSNTGGTIATVAKICTHPKYDNQNHDYDVSVLTLDRALPHGSGIQTIGLELYEVGDGSPGTVTGWGRTSEGGSPSQILQKVDVPKVNYGKCKQIYSTLTERMICFGYDEGGKDSCQGDSGGPIVVNNKQVGIVSWGGGCGRPNMPGVYAKVSNSEISQHINSCAVM